MKGLAPLLLAAGCGAGDPCAGHDGTCIALTIEGPGAVDQLAVHLAGAAAFDGVTPPDGPGPAGALPVETAVYLPDVAGRVAVEVTGLLGGQAIGAGSGSVDLSPGGHPALEILLVSAPPDASGFEGAAADGPSADAGAADAGIPDQAGPADQASPLDRAAPFDQSSASDQANPLDQSAPLDQASPIDQAAPIDRAAPIDQAQPPDLVPPPRIAFLAPARTGDFGDVAGADSACQSAASGTIYQPLTFRAVVADSNGTPAAARLQLAQGRSIVLPGGQAVATDATFFTNTHLAPIDELIDGSVTGIGCAWTNFLPDGSNANQDDCGAWSAKQLLGAFGRTGNSDSQWAAAGPSASCGSPCHIYCIEQ